MSLDYETTYQTLCEHVMAYGELLEMAASNQLLIQLEGVDLFERLMFSLKQAENEMPLYLVTVVANDERELEDHCFKIYYIFSHAEHDLFLTIEYLLATEESYPSIYPHFPAVDPFEREMRDLFGLTPMGERAAAVSAGSWLHTPFPADLYPLRRDCRLSDLSQKVAAYQAEGVHYRSPLGNRQPQAGAFFLPVGPIHAGIIEPGWFVFEVVGEVIEDLHLHLGYTHRGIERLFQSRFLLRDGWRLAEQVSGDSSFVHSLAYCRAAEALADVEVPFEAQLLRALFLEMERCYNHVRDMGALAHDVAANLFASELGVIREKLVALHKELTAHRYLRGLNRPGGVILPKSLNSRRLRDEWLPLLTDAEAIARQLTRMASFRQRALATGILTTTDACHFGATGLIARASDLQRDYRNHHPTGIYRQEWASQELDTIQPLPLEAEEARDGDVYARFLVRLHELRASAHLIQHFLDEWDISSKQNEITFITPIHWHPRHNYTFALGHAEGWRGPVVYWLMQDKFSRIYRCKVCDPSLLNWPLLRQALIPHDVNGHQAQAILPDFPLINKSFNLSYAGNDL